MMEFIYVFLSIIYVATAIVMVVVGITALTSDASEPREMRQGARAILCAPIWPLVLIPFLFWLSFRKIED